MINTLATWHQIIENRDVQQLDNLLADEAVLHSPIVHAPIVGKKMVKMYLRAALLVFATPQFKYVRELSDNFNAVLEFTTEIDGIFVNGVDMITWNEEGKIIDFKVMVRPLKAINLIHQKMGELLKTL
jgi:hypothetical protein